MAAIKLLNLLALSSLAILATSFGVTPVAALATDSHDLSARHVIRGHGAIAKKRRDASSTQRCKPRPSTTPAAQPTNNATPVTSASPAKTTSSSSKPPASSPSSSGGSNNGAAVGKVGIAWPNGDAPGLSNFKTGQNSPLYTWGPYMPSNVKQLGFEPVPQLWGWDQVTDFQNLVVAGYANIVLGMNEPNEPGQSNMDPGSGVQLWRQYIQPLKSQGYKLISPATSSNPNGYTWVQNFVQQCPDCTFDAVALHYYDVTPQGMIDYINKWHDGFGKNIWVTEFACQNFNGGAQCSESQVFNFMQTVTGFMDSTPWVEAYFAFGIMHDMQGVNTLNQLMGSNNEPTALGQMYLQGN